MAGLQVTAPGMLNPPIEKLVDQKLYLIQKRQQLPDSFVEAVQSLFTEWHRVELAEMFVELLDYETVRQAIREQMIDNMEKNTPEPYRDEEEIHWHG
jgi:hypothetical protein